MEKVSAGVVQTAVGPFGRELLHFSETTRGKMAEKSEQA
jgi:hypothetical protein